MLSLEEIKSSAKREHVHAPNAFIKSVCLI